MSFGCNRSPDRAGILIAQLGTPDAPDESSLRTYLKEFLWDPRVIEKNRAVWWLVLNGIVLRKRPARSAALYKRIWTEEGSPLLTITRKQTDGLRERFSRMAPDVEVVFGMRYGNPSFESAISELESKGVRRILVLPMYPQYSGPTTASAYDAIFASVLRRRWVPTLRMIEPYYLDQGYLAAQAKIIDEGCSKLPFKPEKLVLSYHGIPEEYVKKGDPYCCMCAETTRALLPHVSFFKPQDIVHTYQSRFGKDPWLEPYTDETLAKLAESGVKSIAVACPGFTADCLETLDELGNEGRELFLHKGGANYHLLPCLNDHPAWIDAMADICRRALGEWAGRPVDTAVTCPVSQCKGTSICAVN